ncbi:uncharacterized protein TNCV_3539621 [Trichonephila clavipes]|nr:uncharacterized protein TNCV_3539621 [Trichonephila clavipes]
MTIWFHSAAVLFPGAGHHFKPRRPWVCVKGSTPNGHRDPKCSSTRRHHLVREGTGASSEGATCAWMAAEKAVGYHQARRRFVEWAKNEIAVVPNFHKRILFSDEAYFWLNGYVNKQTCRIWSEANPQVYVETPLHPEKLTVALYGLVESLVRTSSKTMKATTLQPMVIDYFLWDNVKSLVYADTPQTLDHLEDNISRVIADIRPQMVEKVFENWTSRLDYIRDSREHGGHGTTPLRLKDDINDSSELGNGV